MTTSSATPTMLAMSHHRARRRSFAHRSAMFAAPLLLALAFVLTGCSGDEASEDRPSNDVVASTTKSTPAVTTTPDPDKPAKPESGLRPVTLALNWFPEVEHGGYYAAQLEGFYAEQGLDVQLIPGGPESAVVPRVATGQVTFGIQNADEVLIANAEGADIVALFAPLQDSPRCIMVHQEAEIYSLDELSKLRTLAMATRSPFAQYLMKTVDLSSVDIVPYHGSIAMFLTQKDYGCQGYAFSEPIIAEQQGAAPQVLMVSQTGFNPYTSVLVCTSAMVREDAELVRGMVMASAKGWDAYLRNPDDVNGYIESINPEMPREVLRLGAQTLPDLCVSELTEAEGLGVMTPDRWRQLYDQLVELELIDAASVDPMTVFRGYFGPGPITANVGDESLPAPESK